MSLPLHGESDSGSRRIRARIVASAGVGMTMIVTSSWLAPSAAADTADALRSAVLQTRSASCGPLRSDPIVEQAAAEINRSTDVWLDEDGRVPPPDTPLPILESLNYGGGSAVQFQGAATTEADAIKGLLLQGYLAIPDCAYTDYGVNVVRNHTTNYFLTQLVLAGP